MPLDGQEEGIFLRQFNSLVQLVLRMGRDLQAPSQMPDRLVMKAVNPAHARKKTVQHRVRLRHSDGMGSRAAAALLLVVDFESRFTFQVLVKSSAKLHVD